MYSPAFTALALSFLLLPSTARVIWVPQDFDPLAGRSLHNGRDIATCGGDSSLTPCGGATPADFCCGSGTTCLALKTSGSVQAAICCPDGQDCSIINPISCDMSLQNITNTQLHVKPPQQLDGCGGQCCPMGYDCNNGQCSAQNAPTPVSQSSPSSTSTASSGNTGTSTPTSAATNNGVQPGLGDPTAAPDGFNGKSFAAGFVPGIAIGAFIAALIILLCIRRRRDSSKYYVDEKPRDTLTDLSPANGHIRNISDPKPDPSTGYRTDFLRHSPTRGDQNAIGYAAGARAPAEAPTTPNDSPPKIKVLSMWSPFITQSAESSPDQPPVPAHLKRPSFSLKISPVRALKKQKSTHSLRRQMTESSQGLRPISRRPHLSRNGSTETIQVLMPSNEPYTPDRPQPIPESAETLGSATYQQQSKSASTWSSTTSATAAPETNTPDERQQPHDSSMQYASSSRYPSEVQPLHVTPTRPPVPRLPDNVAGGQSQPFGFLGSPYTPTKKSIGLAPPGGSNRRDTTFSAMMERAGLRKSDLLVGSGNKAKK